MKQGREKNMFKNGKCVVRRYHKCYGKSLSLTLDSL